MLYKDITVRRGHASVTSSVDNASRSLYVIDADAGNEDMLMASVEPAAFNIFGSLGT